MGNNSITQKPIKYTFSTSQGLVNLDLWLDLEYEVKDCKISKFKPTKFRILDYDECGFPRCWGYNASTANYYLKKLGISKTFGQLKQECINSHKRTIENKLACQRMDDIRNDLKSVLDKYNIKIVWEYGDYDHEYSTKVIEFEDEICGKFDLSDIF